MKRLLLMLTLMCYPFMAYSQQPPNSGSPCPPGMIPGEGGCFSPTDDSRSGQSMQTPTYRGPLWQDRYGAFAVDSATGSYGYTANASSKKAAFNAAVDDCGGGGCKVVSWARNGCLAAASGGGKGNYVVRADLTQAETIALDICSKNSAGNACKIVYSACSLPVRVR